MARDIELMFKNIYVGKARINDSGDVSIIYSAKIIDNDIVSRTDTYLKSLLKNDVIKYRGI